MNKAHGITKENLLASLPAVLANDDNMAALASAVAEVLAARVGEIERVSIYSQIDRLPNELLDILANDFKVDWWDANYTLEEKRRTLKDSWNVHRRLGTKAAVVLAISAIYPDTQVSEWWEYGGKPYHFKLLIDATYEDVDPVRHQRVIDRVAFYKNLRSVLDEVEYYDAGGLATEYFGAACIGCELVDSAAAHSILTRRCFTMATWNGVITNAGNSLLNEWVNEKTLNFDSAAAGQGTVAAAAMWHRPPSSEKQTASLLGGERVSSGIRLKLRIAAPNTAYTLNQFRVSASVDGGASAMIALFQLEQGVPIPSKTESPDFVYTFYALISCSNTGTWTVTVDTSACVTQSDMSTAITEAVKTKQDKIMVKGLLLGDGNGNISAAVAGKDYGYPLATGSGAPTATTEGTAGQHYYDSATGKEYVCSGKDSSGKYQWKLSGASDAADLTYNGKSLDTFLDGVSGRPRHALQGAGRK